ncbi:MAG: hypothetical protein ACREBU_18765 [Nitrososphaera sp.]
MDNAPNEGEEIGMERIVISKTDNIAEVFDYFASQDALRAAGVTKKQIWEAIRRDTRHEGAHALKDHARRIQELERKISEKDSEIMQLKAELAEWAPFKSLLPIIRQTMAEMQSGASNGTAREEFAMYDG